MATVAPEFLDEDDVLESLSTSTAVEDKPKTSIVETAFTTDDSQIELFVVGYDGIQVQPTPQHTHTMPVKKAVMLMTQED